MQEAFCFGCDSNFCYDAQITAFAVKGFYSIFFAIGMTPQSDYLISCIVKNKNDECLTDQGWQSDWNLALLFTPQRGRAILENISKNSPELSPEAVHIIQDRQCNYFAGEEKWSEKVTGAKFLTASEAEKIIKTLR